MSEQAKNSDIRLRRTGGAGLNTQWKWEIVDAEGKVLKSGTALGEEHKAFATAKKAKERLAK
ncbi:hypothetical protein GCM10011321_24540 [Youhaiella tibetensis]|uniref:Uncharacterized protein n=1 Tax=Paradevosia tibetensis TaxID=1447062 RepID=A0A5B9DLI3_9HYPH|nr:hypothetical protein [Youhaiella tibetensis]AKR54391.1 hypothetical protein XM25_00935 [Devosia sp. H5989]QEE19519.1 hypothetical protein FNA67_04730 [Youhaiella tibetensis]GGF32430.1 hypothetical protein GCM10011321_24540 [Youhaiella tibetensis]